MREYLQVVGIRYTELDRIETQIVEYMAYLESARDFKPSESLKKLYWEVAKRIHPDLATDEAERSRRQQLMAEANQAYEDGNEEQLQAILHGWESSPESVKRGGVAAELIRAIRKISQSRDRLKAIETEIEALEQTDLHQLKTQVTTAQQTGQDLLAEMALQLDEQIATQGNVCYESNDYQGAIDAYTQVLSFDPNNSEAYNRRSTARSAFEQ